MTVVLLAVAVFCVGFASALHLVGYGVRGGLAQCLRLWTYRRGGCRCYLCRPDPPPMRPFIDSPLKDARR